MNTPEFVPTEDDLNRAREKQRKVNLYHRVFGTKDGKAVLADIAEHFQTRKPAFLRGIGGTFCPHAAALRDGNREVELYIQHWLSHAAGGDANVEKSLVEVLT